MSVANRGINGFSLFTRGRSSDFGNSGSDLSALGVGESETMNG